MPAKGEIEEVHEWVLPVTKAGEKITDTSLEYLSTIKARIYNVRPVIIRRLRRPGHEVACIRVPGSETTSPQITQS